MLEKLKKRWNIKSNIQLIIILFVFAITGSSTLFVRKGVFVLLGITTDTNILLKTLLYVVIIFPAYQIMFLIFGALFGQFKFVWEFEKKILARFRFRKK